MRKKVKNNLAATLSAMAAFVVWTILIAFVDVQAIGPQESEVGFATINGAFHEITGVHMWIYDLTDWLGLAALLFVAGFGLLGLVQWIQRKKLLAVDADLLVLGGFYVVVLFAYAFFEVVALNYRPILIEGVLEASYPSSTTLLVLCVMPTAMMQFAQRIRQEKLRWMVVGMLGAFAAFMVIGRTLSGVHWLTDIVGGLLLGAGLVLAYRTAVLTIQAKKDNQMK